MCGCMPMTVMPGTFCTGGVRSLCTAGRYGATAGMSSAACSGMCAAGRAGIVDGLTNSSCSGECEAGFYCPAGSTSFTAVPCGNAGVYCPPASGGPTTVSAGYYSSGGSSSTTNTGQTQCERGYYCTNGVRTPCPAGKYRADVGADDLLDCLDCDAGYVCPLASWAGSVSTDSNNLVAECGSSAVYCPAGSSSASVVEAGYYSSGGNSTSTRTAQTICPLG